MFWIWLIGFLAIIIVSPLLALIIFLIEVAYSVGIISVIKQYHVLNVDVQSIKSFQEKYQSDELAEAKKVLENIPDYEGVNELIVKIEKRENEIKEEKYIENYYTAVDLF